MQELIPFSQQLATATAEIQSCQELNRSYGLELTEADVAELVQLRSAVLRATGRVEFGGGILPKLMRAFCSSPYVDRYNYAAVLSELQDAFYYFKNESNDAFSDDDLIQFMAEVFNGPGAGSADLLTAISLEQLCRWAREGFPEDFLQEEGFIERTI